MPRIRYWFILNLLVALIILVSGLSASSPVRASMAGSFGTESRVSPSGKIQAEPSLAADPANGNDLVAAVMDNANQDCLSYRSTNGGQSWGTEVKLLGGPCNDPVVRFGSDGTAYAVFLAGSGSGTGPSYIDFLKSTDQGQTWSGDPTTGGAVHIATATLDTHNCGTFVDKPWLALDSANRILYVSYTKEVFGGSQPCTADQWKMELARSTDGGSTWTTVDVTGYANEGLAASNVAVAPNGDVLVAWYDSLTDGFLQGQMSIQFKSSTNHGQSFPSGQTTAATGYETGYAISEGAGNFGTTTCGFAWYFWGTMDPKLVAGPNPTNPSYYNVYIVYGARPTQLPSGTCEYHNDDADVYFVESTDSGVVFNPPIDLTQGGATGSNNPDQFFPSIALDSDGVLHVTYADMGVDTTQYNRYQVMQRQSAACASTWTSPLPVSSNMYYSTALFVGDYFDITTSGSTVIPIWTDLRGGGASAEVYTAVSTPPAGQNDVGSGGDAGNCFGTATPITLSSSGSFSGSGALASGWDTEDWYLFNVPSTPYQITVSVTPQSTLSVNLELYDPTGIFLAGAYTQVLGNPVSIPYTACSSGNWRTRIVDSSGQGSYTFSVTETSGGSCSTGGGGSIMAGTQVLMSDGTSIPVQNLASDMIIRSFDPASNSFYDATITNVVAKSVNNLYVISTSNGNPIRTDYYENFWVQLPNGQVQWMPAGQVQPGYKILRPTDGSWSTITSIETDTGTYTVYDLIITPTLTGGPMPVIANGYLDMKCVICE